eukprot:scaffold62798_cov43-Phaeocystis_antarctica.AAC.1
MGVTNSNLLSATSCVGLELRPTRLFLDCQRFGYLACSDREKTLESGRCPESRAWRRALPCGAWTTSSAGRVGHSESKRRKKSACDVIGGASGTRREQTAKKSDL